MNNGIGKSTILEALAVKLGWSAEGKASYLLKPAQYQYTSLQSSSVNIGKCRHLQNIGVDQYQKFILSGAPAIKLKTES